MRCAALTIMAVLGLGLITGCEDEIATERTVDVDGNEVTTEERTVSETPDGGVKVTEEKSVEQVGEDE